MFVDFTVESLTQYNLVLDLVEWRGILSLARVEPELDSIELCYVCNYVTVSPQL
jgi:hypothetical protein